MRRGTLSARPTSAPTTSESECGSLLPTPTANDAKKKLWTRCRKTGVIQETLLSRAQWPTPVASDGKRWSGAYGRGNLTLAGASRMWPTPDASAVNISEPLEKWLERRERLKAKKINGNGAGMPLGIAVRLWPTPAARDFRFPNAKSYAERGGGTKGEQLPNAVGGALNPTWVEWLMGFPIGWTGCVVLAMHRSPCKPPSPSNDSWPL